MSDITQAEFDNILKQFLKNFKGTELLSIPGIYEILSEEFNNDVIAVWEKQQNIKNLLN